MRKVIESTLVSLDGVIGDPMTWVNGYFGKQAQEVALAQLMVSDALLMGRHTYEMFATTSDAGTGAYSERMKSMRKYVFSSTLERADWKQTLLEHHLLDELRLWIHPLLVGSGKLLFRQSEKTTLKLVTTKTLEQGVVVLIYQPGAA